MTKIRYWIAYPVLTGLTIWAYYVTRDYLWSTPLGLITVSNLTLNYVLTAGVFGGVGGWLAWNKLFVKWPKMVRTMLTFVTSLIAALVWLMIVSAGGYEVK